MNLHSSTNRKPTVLSKRINLAGFGAVAAAAALMFSADSAHAAAAESKALVAALTAAGTNITDASAAQLAAAVKTVIQNNPKFKPGVVAGEALKTPASLTKDAGDDIAAAVLEQVGAAADRVKIAGDAAKTATTSKLATPLQVPAFTRVLLNSDQEAISAAELARASKNAVGAILGGRATDGLTIAQQTALADQALKNTKLAGAATEISRFVGSAVALIDATQTDEFALNISVLNPKLLVKIAPGVTAAVPENAGEITRQIIGSTNTGIQTSVQKGSALLAKAVSAVADIEQITLIGAYLSDAIGNNLKGSNGKDLISLKSAVTLTKTLAKAIISKPSTGSASTSADNKADEIAEVAAYVVGGIIGNAGISAKTAPKLVLSIIKAAVAGGKATPKQQAADASYIADIAGSVALTIANSALAADIKAAIQTYLTDAKQTKAIGGSLQQGSVTAALTLGFSNSAEANTRLENGNVLSVAVIVDPETDVRNF